jgi:hypothetical protein
LWPYGGGGKSLAAGAAYEVFGLGREGPPRRDKSKLITAYFRVGGIAESGAIPAVFRQGRVSLKIAILARYRAAPDTLRRRERV